MSTGTEVADARFYEMVHHSRQSERARGARHELAEPVQPLSGPAELLGGSSDNPAGSAEPTPP